jgi:2-polyprenyl-6-methoxyphenol hydroxylase-like FAD-dependent oxidoreductase
MHRKFPQFWFDPMLERAGLRQGMTEIRYGLEFVDRTQDNDGVTFLVKRAAETE